MLICNTHFTFSSAHICPPSLSTMANAASLEEEDEQKMKNYIVSPLSERPWYFSKSTENLSGRFATLMPLRYNSTGITITSVHSGLRHCNVAISLLLNRDYITIRWWDLYTDRKQFLLSSTPTDHSCASILWAGRDNKNVTDRLKDLFFLFFRLGLYQKTWVLASSCRDLSQQMIRPGQTSWSTSGRSIRMSPPLATSPAVGTYSISYHQILWVYKI